MYYPIDENMARLSHQMMSMRDYKAGSATAEYQAAVDKAAALVAQRKQKVSTFYHSKLDGLLDRYARRLAQWTNDHNRNGASCPSVLICGAANFPVRKKEKQNAREDSLWKEYQNIQGILSKIKSVGTGPIDFSDPNARKMLVERLEAAKALHESKKQANAYYRKHKTLDGCPGITEKDREWLTRPGVFAKGDGSPLALYGIPFPSYDLQRDTADIRRYAARLEEYDKLQAQHDTGTEFDGGRIIRNVEQSRLQIEFDEIPGQEVRDALKSSGFRWSRKNQAWQRQLTDNAERAARRILNLPDAAPAVIPPEDTTPAESAEVLPMDETKSQCFPAYRLVAAFADGQRLTFDGLTWEQAHDAMEAAQEEHGDLTWFDGVTDEHYENGCFYAAVPPPPHSPFPIIDTTDDPSFEQQRLF